VGALGNPLVSKVVIALVAVVVHELVGALGNPLVDSIVGALVNCVVS
jgi:hypothetical protein